MKKYVKSSKVTAASEDAYDRFEELREEVGDSAILDEMGYYFSSDQLNEIVDDFRATWGLDD